MHHTSLTSPWTTKISEKNHGFTTHQRLSSRNKEIKLPDLDFADDLALMDDGIDEAQLHTDDVARECKKVGLEVNVGKTEYSTYNINTDKGITINNKQLKKTDNFKYLGSMTRSSRDDITRRRALAFSTFYTMNNIWSNSVIPIPLKVKIFKVSVLTVFLYGCESWTLNEADKDSINSFATTCYRRILDIDQAIEHVTNKEVLKRVKSTELILHIQKRQLEKTGHRLRKPESSLANRFALYVPKHGRRGPGRPRTSFTNTITNIINPTVRLSEAEVRRHAQDRDSWKEMIKDRTTQ